MSRPCEAWVAACVDAAEGGMDDAFRRHIESCEDCRSSFDDLRESLEMIDPEPAPVPGPWMATKIRRAAEKGREKRPSRRLAVLAPMAAAAGILMLIASVGSRGGDPESPYAASRSEPQATVSVMPTETGPAADMEDEMAHYARHDDWGMGVDTLLASAEAGDLERLIESLPQ